MDRIKSTSTWFIKDGTLGAPVTYPEGLVQLASDWNRFAQVISESDPKTLLSNLEQAFGAYRSVRLAMLGTGIGVTPLNNLSLFLDYKNALKDPITLDASVAREDQIFPVSRTLSALGMRARLGVTQRKLEYLPVDTLRDLLFVLCFGSFIKELGYFVTWRRCNLAIYCGEPVEKILGGLLVALFAANPQIAGRANVDTGERAELKVRKLVEEIIKEKGGWLSITSEPPPFLAEIADEEEENERARKPYDLILKMQDPASLSESPPVYFVIEIAWQETGNSIIHRKDKLYETVRTKCDQIQSFFVLVVDGVGYFSREKAMRKLSEIGHEVVGLSDIELKRLEQFIRTKLLEYQKKSTR